MPSLKQLRILATQPAAYLRFRTTGRLPGGVVPKSPLITLLRAMSSRDLGLIRGLRVDARLGYSGARQFHFAAQALRWVCPDEEVFGAFPAESWRIKGFNQPLYLEDLAACCAQFDSRLLAKYPQLCRGTGTGADPVLDSADAHRG